MKRQRVFLILLIFVPLTGLAQPVVVSVKDTTIPYKERRKHDTRMAAGTFLASESLPVIFDRYIFNKDYARISFQTIGSHLSPSAWQWDDDGFQTNQIGHPYHGSVFFNTFRSNGYGFYQSAAAAFAGSLIWEIAAENQAPAPNDFINTGFGGMVLGETMHRLTGKLRNGYGTRGNRQAKEVLSFLLDPAGGISRLLKGEWGRPVFATGNMDSIPMSIEIEGGLRKYSINGQDPFRDGHLGAYCRLHMEYGSMGLERGAPFSHINILVEGGRDDSSRINIVSVYGSLYGRELRLGGMRVNLSVSANYEYINNQAFFYSAQSLRVNLSRVFRLSRFMQLSANIAAGPILLAAVPDGYLYEGRDYDYGPGMAFNTGARLTIGHRVSYRFALRGGWMKTASGNGSDYYLHAFTNELDLALWDHFSVGAEEGYFSLHGNYRKFPRVSKTYPYVRLSVKYGIQFQ